MAGKKGEEMWQDKRWEDTRGEGEREGVRARDDDTAPSSSASLHHKDKNDKIPRHGEREGVQGDDAREGGQGADVGVKRQRQDFVSWARKRVQLPIELLWVTGLLSYGGFT